MNLIQTHLVQKTLFLSAIFFSTQVLASIPSTTTNSNSNSNSQSTTHKNTKLNSGGKLTINTDSTTIKGANVSADELDINTKKLTIASIQNTSTSKSQTDSANASGSIGATGASILGSGVSTETTKANRKYTDQQTTLIGRKKVTIKTKDLNITGATIANKDPDTYDKEGKLIHTGKDKGNLSIETETLTVVHLKNQDQSKTKGTSAGYGANISAGQTHESKDKQGQTKATIGKGKIKVNNKKDKSKLAKLNRDTDNTQETTKDWETKRMDIKAKIDKRVFSEKGRKSIKKDFKKADPVFNLITLGIMPTYTGNGGLLTQIPVLFIGDMRKNGDLSSDNVYINGMLNTDKDAREGANNIIGGNSDKQVWINPTHGLIGDLTESAVDKFGGITGNKRQVARWKQEAADKGIKYNIYMHSQGNLIGGSDTNRNHNYYSYGAPISRDSIKNKFGEDTHIEMNKNDPVSGFGGNYMWLGGKGLDEKHGGHSSECYGVSRENCQ